MNNRITQLFQQKTEKDKLLSIFFTAGYPNLKDTVPIIQHLAEAGVDMIEIGIPFSDPVADGPTIQHSSEVALENGMTLKILLEQLKDIRQTVQIPLLLMGYINPILQYGLDAFCKDIAAIGIDGVILPDLPIKEYRKHYQHLFEEHQLSNILLITPQTSEQRIRLIDDNTDGFIYMVSSDSTTGKTNGISSNQQAYFTRIQEMSLKNPTVIGFGIGDYDSFTQATVYAAGAIVGSAFIKCLQAEGELKEKIRMFVQQMRQKETLEYC